jgi:hypothetical protein
MSGRFPWLIVLIAGGVAGCGADNGLTLGRVRGKITYQGELVRWGRILFTPDRARGTEGPTAMGLISKEGTYALATESADDGVIVGFHKVGIVGLDPTPLSAPAEPPAEQAKLVVAAKVQRVKTAQAEQLRSSAKRAGTGERTMRTVDGKTYRIVVPDKVLNPDSSGVTVEVQHGSQTIDFDVKEDGSVAVKTQ